MSTHERLAKIGKRFEEAARVHRTTWYTSNRKLFRDRPQARVLWCRHQALEKMADELRDWIEKWLSHDFKFDYIERNPKEFDRVLRLKAYFSFNVDYLRDILDDLRRNASADYKAFDKAVYEDDAIGLLLDAAEEGWNRNGAESLLQRAVTLLQARFQGLDLRLLTEEQAVEQLYDMFEMYATDYEKLLAESKEMERQAEELAPEPVRRNHQS